MLNILKGIGAITVVCSLAACGTSTQTSTVSTSTARGTLALDPPLRIASLGASAFQAQLAATTSGAELLALANAPVCGVDFYYVKFWTVGGANETTESSGALMVPTGAAPACSGPRPIVLYAHGTASDKNTNIADITNTGNTEGALIAAIYAAQGYIVVAPNYAGYDISTLGYHPYLNAVQNSSEMIDILAAARTALPSTLSSATSDNGQLFITGYSEGGYVAMATQRAIEAAGGKVTAAAPLSGPYALEAFSDTVFLGGVNLGATVFSPLLTTSYQHAYGNIYSATTDVYTAAYANGIDTLLPSVTSLNSLFSEGLLPTAEFDSTTPTVTIPGQAQLSGILTAALTEPSPTSSAFAPVFDVGFGNPFLILDTYRVSYAINAASFPDGAGPLAALASPTATSTLPTLPATIPSATLAPAYNFRLALNTNDLRNPAWAPHSPTLLCGGDADPTVFFSVNTGTMKTFWSNLPAGLVTVLDVNGTPAGPFAQIQTAYRASQAALLAAGETEQQVVAQTHTAEAPFCTLAARSFFTQFLGG